MTKPFGLSPEHDIFYSLMKCPLCSDFPIVPAYFTGDGDPIDRKTSFLEMHVSALAECPKCKERWPVFSSSTNGVTRQQTITVESTNISNPEPKPPRGMSDSLRKPFTSEDLKLRETSRTEELLGTEQRLIDNSRSAIRMERRFTISKEWSQSYSVDYEKSSSASGGFGFDVPFMGNLKLAADRAIKDKYSITEGIRLTYSEEVTLHVPENKKIRVRFEWKRLWQLGVIELENQDGEQIQVPFQVAIGVTFDQTQIDEP